MRMYISTLAKVVAAILLAFAAVFSFREGYYFTAAIAAVAFCAITVSVCLIQQRRVVRRMEQMIQRIRYGDLNISFYEGGKGVEGSLNRSMNLALESFRSRLSQAIMTEAETAAWQKLIRVLSHEIMNSLTPVISLSETMTDRAAAYGYTEKEYGVMLEAMRSIHRRSQGLLSFVENYRQLTRIPEPRPNFFGVAELFDTMGRLTAGEKAPVTFSVRSPGLRMYADRGQMEQVLINLVKNAVEAVADSAAPEVAVEAFLRDGAVVITVADNGHGIEQENLDRIFVPFYTTKQGGSGIGLSLSRQMIDNNKGSISVESPAGGGTVFILKFANNL